MENFGKFIMYTIMIVLLTVWGGYVLSVMWGWFIVPVFHAPVLNIPQAIGISLMSAMLAKGRPKNDEPLYVACVEGFVFSLLFLGVGFIVKQFL